MIVVVKIAALVVFAFGGIFLPILALIHLIKENNAMKKARKAYK